MKEITAMLGAAGNAVALTSRKLFDMNFIVVGHKAGMDAVFYKETPESALKKARDLECAHHEAVVIRDINGRDYEPTQFDRVLVNPGRRA